MLSALRTGRLYLAKDIPGTHFCYRLRRPQGHSAAGRNKSMKNPDYRIENRTLDLPACSAVSHPTAPQRAQTRISVKIDLQVGCVAQLNIL
jgi:hypothetical protein